MNMILKDALRRVFVLLLVLSLPVLLTAFLQPLDNAREAEKRALIVIDVQNIYFSDSFHVTYPEGSLQNILSAMDAADAHGIPIVVVQHTSRSNSKSFSRGSFAWQLREEVAKKPRTILIEKNFPGSFTGTDLEKWLRENGITTVTITGYMTQMCCDSTARQAYHLGFGVEFLSDATGTMGIENGAGKVSAQELHNAILVTQASVFSKVLTTKEWIESLE